MKISVTSATPSPPGLRLGLRVEHEKAGWIRFATTVLVFDELDAETLAAITHWLNHRRDVFREDLDQALDLDWG